MVFFNHEQGNGEQQGNAGPSQNSIRNIYTALSKEHCFAIFDALHDKALSSKELLGACKCTRREYYLAIDTLRMSKLIEKRGGKYGLTSIGAFIYSNQIYTWNAMQHADKFELYSKVNGILNQNPSEHALELSAMMLKELEGTIGTSTLEPVVIYLAWEDLSKDLFQFIENARSEVLLANRTLDPNAVPPVIKATRAGKKVRILNDIDLVNQRLKLATMDKNIMSLYRSLFSSSGVKIRVTGVPYSFVIVDGLELGIEIINPIKLNQFFIGYRFRSATLAEKMKSFYEEMWESAREYKIEDVNKIYAEAY